MSERSASGTGEIRMETDVSDGAIAENAAVSLFAHKRFGTRVRNPFLANNGQVCLPLVTCGCFTHLAVCNGYRETYPGPQHPMVSGLGNWREEFVSHGSEQGRDASRARDVRAHS